MKRMTSRKTEHEEGELSSNEDQEHETEQEVNNESDQLETDQSDQATTRQVRNKGKKSRPSVEEKLDEVSSTLKVMQDLMIKKGMFEEFQEIQKNHREKPHAAKRRASGGNQNNGNDNLPNLNDSYSETTIYKDVIKKESASFNVSQQVDPEITFNLNALKTNEKCNSSSSDKQIDTSDDLIDVDNFIADCQAAAMGSKVTATVAHSPRLGGSRQVIERQDEGDRDIQDAEAGKARVMDTPGRSPLDRQIFQGPSVFNR